MTLIGGNITQRKKEREGGGIQNRRRNLIHRQIGLLTLNFTKKLCNITHELEDLFCSEDLSLIIIIFMYIIFRWRIEKDVYFFFYIDCFM